MSGSDAAEVFGAGDEEKKKEASIQDYWRIFKYADKQDMFFYIVAIGFSIASGAALPLMALILGGFTTDFSHFQQGRTSEGTFRTQADRLVLWLIWLFIARFFLVYVCNFLANVAAVRITRNIRTAFLDSTLRKEVWYFDEQTNGSAATQVTTHGNRINQGIAEKLMAIVHGVSLFCSSFTIALAVQWSLALICMSIVPALFLVVGGVIAVDAKQEARITKFYSTAAILAQDAISSIRTIHALGAQNKMVERYDFYLKLAHEEGLKKRRSYAIMFSTQTFLVFCATSLAFWQGHRMYSWGEIDNVGTVFTVVLIITIGTTSVSIVGPHLQAVAHASSAASELFTTIDKQSLLDPLSDGGKQPPSCEGHIEVRNLSFCYPHRLKAKVLTDFTLSIPAGKTTALVGPSGCGKSTLVGLLERWYHYESGNILLDGVELAEYNTKWLRSNIRLVQQEPVLFSGTVFENVSKGLVGNQLALPHHEQMELVQEACRQSNAHDFIMELPKGYDAQVGERATMLSGGQRQRIAIARSIISRPKILLLDEPTSALDPAAEKIVQAALDEVSRNRTTLIIAHKLLTVKGADNIAVMKEGVVFEQGTHLELMERNGHYAAMVRAQDLSANAGEAEIASESDQGGDGAFERQTWSQRTKTDVTSSTAEMKVKDLTNGTLGYGLLKCIWIMFSEHPQLYRCYAVSALGCLIGGGTYPAQAILFSRLIGVFAIQDPAQADNRADFFSLMLFFLALANWFGYFGIGWSAAVIGQDVIHCYRKEMLERLMNLDQDFFDRVENSSGSLTSRLSSVPASLQELISGNIMLMCIVLVNMTASSIVSIAYGWKLGMVFVFGGLPILVGCGYLRVRLERKLEWDAENRFADAAGHATEAVTAIRTVSSLTLEGQVTREYNKVMDTIVRRSTKGFLMTMVPYALSQSLEFPILALGFWYGSRLIASEEYTVDQFFVVFLAVVFGGQAAAQFFGNSSSITKAESAANYILWLRTVKAKISETPDNKGKGPSGEGPIVTEDVEFRYIQRHDSRILRGISMNIDPGQFIAVVGPSGCGKSTLIFLLERFYEPSSGRISLNSEDIATMSPQLYRQYMSLVQQEPPLFQGSIRENICLGLQYEPTDEEVHESLRQSDGLEFVSSLPEGLSTPCGSRGLQLSGGQRQRIVMAQALIRKPKLLLLDEATSALDTISERNMQKALDKAANTRTTIAVAHRLSTIRHADVIYVLANGNIQEVGTHEELQALKGKYFAMCLAQRVD